MAKGNAIVVSAEARGRRLWGYIASGQTPKPGTIHQISTSVALDSNGLFTFTVYNADADGGRPKGPLWVLDYDETQGKLATSAYAAGDLAPFYCPLPGDELNMLILNIAGTADDHAYGEILIANDGTGKLIATASTPETEMFMLLETITDPTADTLAHVIYTGY